MKITVSTHQLPGYGATLRTAKRMTEHAVRLVNRAVPGRMPDVEVILTNERGMAEQGAAADLALAGSTDRSAKKRAERWAKQIARTSHARAIPRPDGSALILVNAHKATSPAEFGLIIVHELVHAMQFSRKDVPERYQRAVRDGLGIERQSRRDAREHERLMRQEEAEAYGHEYLHKQLGYGAAA
ncbi:hypothetical protein [Streptomyces sp. cf386]|uniref:hypothetical protein n=1 Tax=Streptomyces sp. cf386 TaxID=1761904 RepID=UPI000AD4EC17|nr:hypothetical protein [Streptomyces sp. cf386]